MSSNGTKTRRVTQACDFCHRRGLKCKSEEQSPINKQISCRTCVEFGEVCTRQRKAKKRGTKRQTTKSLLEPGRDSRIDGVLTGSSTSSDSIISSRNRKVVTELLDVYLDTVHPMFPLFCERELWVGWREGSFPASASDYMNLVCMCALSALHADNRALFSDDEVFPNTYSLAQAYSIEAEALVAKYCETAGTIELIRSCGFLALVGAQSGNTTLLHKYLGLFHTISSRSNYQDEANWPSDMSDCQREVRRRLWWAMYRLEVHTACMFGTMIRCSETQCDVGYPSGLHHPAFVPGRDGQFEDWFSGWNLTTDLYRLLEHAVLNLRSKRRKQNSIFQGHSGPDITEVMSRLSELQGQILPQFESVASRSSDNGRNRCGFQTCNILCTIHLARMMASLANQQGVYAACQAARDMMANMNSIPHEYIRATGSPLLQQLAGVGHMLISTAKKEEIIGLHYTDFRDAVTLIVDFLTRFEEFSKFAVNAKTRLFTELHDFNEHIQSLGGFAGTGCNELAVDIMDPMSYFDLAALGGTYNDQDFMNANLLKGFARPDMGSPTT